MHIADQDTGAAHVIAHKDTAVYNGKIQKFPVGMAAKQLLILLTVNQAAGQPWLHHLIIVEKIHIQVLFRFIFLINRTYLADDFPHRFSSLIFLIKPIQIYGGSDVAVPVHENNPRKINAVVL